MGYDDKHKKEERETMKYIVLSVTVLLMFGGCAGMMKAKPESKPVVKKVVEPKPAPASGQRKLKKGEVPPLPEREVDVDMDSMVDQAADEVLGNGGAVKE
jgi:hypothetical protein